MLPHGLSLFVHRHLLAGLCILGFVISGAFAQVPGKKVFSIPAMTADKSLKLFVAQSGMEVVYPAAVVKGVRTRGVKGSMIPAEAMKRLLDGTELASAQDERTGAFSISRRNLPNG